MLQAASDKKKLVQARFHDCGARENNAYTNTSNIGSWNTFGSLNSFKISKVKGYGDRDSGYKATIVQWKLNYEELY